MSSSSKVSAAQQHLWSEEETREFIRIRAELEREWTAGAAAKKKTMWEMASDRMRERGFWRTPDQCKCKWKNLLSRYKGKETSHPEYNWQCQFFEEIHAVFAEREKAMKQLLLNPEAGSSSTKKRMRERSLAEFSDDNEDDESENDEMPTPSNSQKRKTQQRSIPAKSSAKATNSKNRSGSINNEIVEMLNGFFQWQQRMEMEWREIFERHYYERKSFEREWHQAMEKLERERLMDEQAWRERVEERRKREDIRAEERNALLTTLLNKLNRENDL